MELLIDMGMKVFASIGFIMVLLVVLVGFIDLLEKLDQYRYKDQAEQLTKDNLAYRSELSKYQDRFGFIEELPEDEGMEDETT